MLEKDKNKITNNLNNVVALVNEIPETSEKITLLDDLCNEIEQLKISLKENRRITAETILLHFFNKRKLYTEHLHLRKTDDTVWDILAFDIPLCKIDIAGKTATFYSMDSIRHGLNVAIENIYIDISQDESYLLCLKKLTKKSPLRMFCGKLFYGIPSYTEVKKEYEHLTSAIVRVEKEIEKKRVSIKNITQMQEELVPFLNKITTQLYSDLEEESFKLVLEDMPMQRNSYKGVFFDGKNL